MDKKKKELAMQSEMLINEAVLFDHVSAIIENRKLRAQAQANQESVLMFWEIGKYIGSVILGGERAGYGKQIVVTLSQQLQEKYGSSFEYSNVTRMIRFAARFPDSQIVVPLAQQLSWSHFIALLPLKSDEAFMFYAQDVIDRRFGVRELRRQVSRKAFERREIANSALTEQSSVPFNTFKDPFLLDVFDLKDNYVEADLEKAILADVQKFILEFGHGFAFIESQKRMPIGDEFVTLDLLFFNRNLKRLVAVELKLGVFQAAFKGQMELYLAWLDEYERKEGENPPIGIILCASANRKKVEMLKMDRAGIAVAEYWTELPPKAVFEQKIKEIMQEAQERLERRKALPSASKKQIEYYLDKKNDDEE
ncbi:MAG: PDDEXK nuclease domain-containing protein [Clostridiales bacterium]|nr:PDDEXK nuclease domain-containing protein [Clostridiales bacterium]